jgi:hypothetical protein
MLPACRRFFAVFTRFAPNTVGNLSGTSLEAKDKAVAVFYERLRSLEQQLERIQLDLRLG